MTTSLTPKYAGKRVVLTRETGKNGDMRQRLEKHGVEVVEMPLIETAVGVDRSRLAAALVHENGWDWICITSPEAAAVFLEAWEVAGKPDVPIATVGKGTARILKSEYESGALTAATFTPSTANAETLVAELPVSGDVKKKPASCTPPPPRRRARYKTGLRHETRRSRV